MKATELVQDAHAHNGRECEICHVQMKLGLAFVPVLGGSVPMARDKGQCLRPVTAVPAHVLKCPKCGHSVMYGRLYC